MSRHTYRKRELPGTNSGWKHAVNSEVIPITAWEVLNGDRKVVAVYWNNGSTPGNICPDVAARNECRYLNRDFSDAGMQYWAEKTGRINRKGCTTK